MAHEELLEVPTNLTLQSDDELIDLEGRAIAEFDRVNAVEDADPELLQYQVRLTDDIDRIRAEKATREVRARETAQRQRAQVQEQRSQLQTRVHGAGEGDQPVAVGVDGASVDAAAIAEATAQGVVAAMVAMGGRPGGSFDFGEITKRASASLSDARRHAPAVSKLRSVAPAVTAGVDIPGIPHGGELNTLDALIDAFHRRAKGMPVTNGMPNEQLVASVRNEFEHTVDDRTSPAQIEELLSYLTRPDQKEALVAGGGWCAPSEIKYDFFNVACVDGLIDLPTVGIQRGGIRFPVSPSIADAFGSNALGGFAVTFNNASVPWLWTETDDVLTVTGTTNKPTMRVPCPTFDERRLECYGVTLTAGNLTDSAYPEATANTLRLLLNAHEHAMNARFIATMVGMSSAAVTGGGFAEANDVVTQVLSGVALAATDYRARYAMCKDDVLEVVAPYWLLEVLRAGLAWRVATEQTSVADGVIQSYFADRGVRVQWVGDWQVRGASQFGASTAMTAWPTSAQVMIYAAGTFIKGNGLSLDLGVVRDSTLNAENDFTAAWSEECHLIAKVGHESRLYTLGFSVSALTPPAATAAPNL